MNPSTLEDLRAELAELESTAKAIRAVIAKYEVKQQQSPMLPLPIGKRAIDAAYDVLFMGSQPMSRQDIVAALEAQGITVVPDTLSQTMSRDDRFVGVGRGQGAKWALASFTPATIINGAANNPTNLDQN